VAKPLLGGLSIFLASFATALLVYQLSPAYVSVLAGATIIVATGVIDDIYNLKPICKLAGQSAAAASLVLLNISAYAVLIDVMRKFHVPQFVTLVLIIGWVMLMINAFNLIDGLDGLAVGIASIIILALGVISLLNGSNGLVGAKLILLGAFLGFLPYNFEPAKIFLGDTGSMLIGFMLSAVHLFTISEPFSSAMVLGSAFFFAYPALYVTFAIYRRLRNRTSIFRSDRQHVHHLLLRLGFSVRKVVLILYLASLFFAALGVLFLTVAVNPYVFLVIGILTVAGVVCLFIWLNRISKKDTVAGTTGDAPVLTADI
jgi:UDP-GlcNAc:undecaprenyl-phosphate GlcNAc-1-phosphate transferase